MTFDDARQKLLARYDRATATIRTIIADPKWCNPGYKAYKDAVNEVMETIKAIERLNDAESSATEEYQ